MGKLFKIDLGEEDELFLGYHQKKLYQHFRTCCKNKLKQLTKYQKKLNRKYFETNNNHQSSFNNQNSTILTDELGNQLNYYYELNKYAINLLNYDGPSTASATNTDSNNNNNNDIKTEIDDNDNDNMIAENNHNMDNLTDNTNDATNMVIDIDCNSLNYNDYKSVLDDIAYNDNTRNYKIFSKIFQDKQRNQKQTETNNNLAIDGAEIYCCIRCGMHLTKKSLVMDENFHGRTGPSFLIQSVFNIDIGPKATRKLHTGMHVVSDVFCKRCSTNVGWYYHEASKLEQQYKISHYVLECCLICTFNQYMMHNYHSPNNLLPTLNFNTFTHKNNKINNDSNNESDDDGDGDVDGESDDDTMNDLSHPNMSESQVTLPSYMSYDHPSFCGVFPRNAMGGNAREYDGKYSKKRKDKIKHELDDKCAENVDDCDDKQDDEAARYKMKHSKRRKDGRILVPRLTLQHISAHSDVSQRRGSIKSDYSNSNESNKTYDEEEEDEEDEEDEEEEEEEEDEDDEPEQEESSQVEQRVYHRRRGVRFADLDDEDDEDEDDEESLSTESEQIGSATDSESEDESDNETAERVSSIENDDDDDDEEEEDVTEQVEEVDVD